nr:uncharacterized protein LOC110358551 isoform X1 [Columba livia]
MHQEASCRVGPYAGFTLSSSVCQVLWLIEACEKQQHPLTERECEGWFSPTSAAPGKARKVPVAARVTCQDSLCTWGCVQIPLTWQYMKYHLAQETAGLHHVSICVYTLCGVNSSSEQICSFSAKKHDSASIQTGRRNKRFPNQLSLGSCATCLHEDRHLHQRKEPGPGPGPPLTRLCSGLAPQLTQQPRSHSTVIQDAEAKCSSRASKAGLKHPHPNEGSVPGCQGWRCWKNPFYQTCTAPFSGKRSVHACCLLQQGWLMN